VVVEEAEGCNLHYYEFTGLLSPGFKYGVKGIPTSVHYASYFAPKIINALRFFTNYTFLLLPASCLFPIQLLILNAGHGEENGCSLRIGFQ